MTLTSKLLSEIPFIKHAFFTREGGVSTGIYGSLNAGIGSNDDPLKVRENRLRMANHMGVAEARFLTAYQTHSADALIVSEPFTERPKCDGLVTTTPNLAISASHADCTPILFCDPKARVIAATHSGWKGALSGVLEDTVLKMTACGASAANIVVCIGATIRQPSYEVGEEFYAAFLAKNASFKQFFIKAEKPNHFLFDLPALVTLRLREAGVTKIDDLEIDTYSDRRFFSYRRMTHLKEADYGRHLASIKLL